MINCGCITVAPRRVYYAHSTGRPDRADWQPLREHLHQVADLARDRAAKFGAGEWGYVAGLLHDLGKYSAEFQARLEGRSGRVDHSTAGAIEAGKRWQDARPTASVCGRWPPCGPRQRR